MGDGERGAALIVPPLHDIGSFRTGLLVGLHLTLIQVSWPAVEEYFTAMSALLEFERSGGQVPFD